MENLATRVAVIATVAFGILIGGGGLAAEVAEDKYRHYCPIEIEIPNDEEPEGCPYCTNP